METRPSSSTRILAVATAVVLLLTVLVLGCKKDAPPSLYDPTATGLPPATITGISPSGSALAGVSLVTLNGTNFSADPTREMVFFNKLMAKIIQASATQLVVQAPVIVSDSIMIRVTVLGSDIFSTPFAYRLTPAVATLGKFDGATEKPFALATDTSTFLYASVVSGGAGIGVVKFGDTSRSIFSARLNSFNNSYTGMRFGWGGALYAVGHKTTIIVMPAGGGAPTLWIQSGLGTIDDLDFDQDGNAWCAGKGTSSNATTIYRVTSTKAITSFPFRADVRSVRVYNGYLYMSGRRDSTEAVWRLPLSGGVPGAEELYFDMTAFYGGKQYQANAITFSSDGYLYIGTDSPDGIVRVDPDPARTGSAYYPGLLSSPIISLAWGPGPYLYASLGLPSLTPAILKINTEKTTAPYYGLGL